MRSAEFRSWLSSRTWNGKPLAAAAIASRMGWLRTLERALPALGFDQVELDAVHASHCWGALLDTLRRLTNDWHINEVAARSMAPEAEDPKGQIGNVLAVARLYGHFADGRDPDYDFRDSGGDSRFTAGMAGMRETFVSRMHDFHDMAREDGEYWEVEKSYKYAARGDVRTFSADPNLSDEQRGKAIYERLCQSTIQGLPLSWRTRAEVMKAPAKLQTRFYNAIAGLGRSDKPIAELAEEGARALEALRNDGIDGLRRGEVLNIILSVLGSLRPDESCWFKTSMFDKAAVLLTGQRLFPSPTFDRAEFEAFQMLLFRIRDVLERDWDWAPESLEDVQGFLWVALSETWDGDWGMHPNRQAVDAAMAEYDELGAIGFAAKHPGFGTPTDYWVRGQDARSATIYPSKPIAAVAMGWESIKGGWSKPDSACSLLQRAGYQIVDANGDPVIPPDKPYLAATNATKKGADVTTLQSDAINLILYGPPGTGKTWRTAEEAVKLCDGVVPADRVALMSRYRELVEARRIDFVTFHQSYSYEEFIEGLRPVQAGSESDEPGVGGAGFSLNPEDGVFRRIARRAAASKSGGGQFEVGDRRVFKLSIGEAANAEDDYLIEEAIAEGHAILGYDDIDWTEAKFGDRNAIIEACAAFDRRHPDSDRRKPTPQSGRVQCPLIFRNWMKRGDLVVVSKGNLKFRAIGEVTGDYEYSPRESGAYSHRRKVKWLWIDKVGAPVEDIYAKGFSQRAVYVLTPSDLNSRALEAYINSQLPGAAPSGPEPYVLIIDEINRGNISKIFGELITLIEPDKRTGMPNAIEVRLPYSKEPFSVPANLHIIGTMNTADRSIALLDTALRRRFVFREIAPEPELLPEDVEGVPLRRVLETINDRIEYLIGREHRIGHAFFLNDGGKDRAAIGATMRDKIIPLLQEYFFEDWSRVAAVLGEPQGKGGGFLDCRKLRDPTGQDGEERESWTIRGAFATDAYDRLVGKPAPAATTEEPIGETAQ